MGIFSKKTNQPLDSDDLAKRVEEYNRNFLASQEQPKTEAAQAISNTTKPVTAPRQGNFDGEGFRIVSDENMNYAYGHMHRFVGTIVNEKVKAITLNCFDGDTPRRTVFRAASQFFNLTFLKIWHMDSYSQDDMDYDMSKLCDFINAQDDIGLFAFMMGYSKYIAQEIKKNLQNGGFTEEEISSLMVSIESARDTIFKVTEKKMH